MYVETNSLNGTFVNLRAKENVSHITTKFVTDMKYQY